MILAPTVELWAKTEVTPKLLGRMPYDDTNDETCDADLLAEAAGRVCYAAGPLRRANPSTNTTESYLANILRLKHHSVLAHASATFYIAGVSRSLTHELIRSRFLSFSQISQRYVDSSEMDWVCPVLYLDDSDAQRECDDAFRIAVRAYERLVPRQESRLVAQGLPATLARKRAREAARAVLPNEVETRLVVGGNLRAWRDFLALRWSEAADLEIERLAAEVYRQLALEAPWTFQDMERAG